MLIFYLWENIKYDYSVYIICLLRYAQTFEALLVNNVSSMLSILREENLTLVITLL